MTASPLSPHILHVVALGSQKQMARINASAVVASVQNTAAVDTAKVGDFAVVQLIANPMGSTLELVKRNLTIACRHRRQLPRPAFVMPPLLNVGPELGADVRLCRQNPVPYRTTSWRAKTARSRAIHIVPTTNTKFPATRLTRCKEAPKAGRLVSTTSGAQGTRCSPLAENRAANSARRVAMFNWWCHGNGIHNAMFDDNLIAIGFPLTQQEPPL